MYKILFVFDIIRLGCDEMNKEQVEILRLDHSGRGIGKLNNKTIFIPNTLPTEVVTIKNKVEKKKFIEAEVSEWVKTSDKRVEAKCPYYDACGGCDLMHMTYPQQLQYKKNKICDILTRFSDFSTGLVKEIVYDTEFYYRNKVVFHNKEVLGLYKKKSYDLIPVEKCYLIDEEMNLLLKVIRNMDLSCVKEVMFRRSNRTKEIMVVFSLNKYQKIDCSKLKEHVTSIYTVYNNSYEKIYGNDYLTENLLGLSFDISPSAFFQVNTVMCEKLYTQVKTYLQASKDDQLLDLYCGTGTIGLTMASDVKKVIGVEINPDSIKDANRNKDKNGIRNAEFYASKVSDMIEELQGSLVVVDPPRAGLDSKTISELKTIKPKKLVYVSCDPMTLVRDLKDLSSDFDIKEITLFDMFPQTAHVESVVLLQLKQNL